MIETFFIILSRLLLVFIGFKLYRMCSKWDVLKLLLIGRNGKVTPAAPSAQQGVISIRNPLEKMAAKTRSRKLGGTYKAPWGW